MPLRPGALHALGLLFVFGGALAGRWLSAPFGRGTLEIPLAAASVAPPKLAPREISPAPAAVSPPTPIAAAAPSPAPATIARPGVPKTWLSTLIVGLDRRPDARGAGLADTQIVAVFDEKNGHAGVVSVPRDLWVTIPDYGDDRINVIPTVARRLKKDPLELFARVLSDTLGLHVEHAVVVDLGVFERSVDLVGGVEVDVPCPIVDSFLDERVAGGRRKLDLPAGRETLDGATAAMYVRSRHGRSDFGRSRRQQAVLLGLRDRVLESDGWTLVPTLFDEVESSLVTNLKRFELLDLARRALELDRSRLHGLVLAPPLTTGHRTEDGKSVLLPEREAIDRAIAGLFSAAPPGDPPTAVCPPADAALKNR
ncbi:MAG TPA: LCP family protein [Polyangiaceae bacterium]|nr:LCP family protein [Polyangiaceae bacterium]